MITVCVTATVHSAEYYGLWYCHSTQCRVLGFMVLPQYTVQSIVVCGTATVHSVEYYGITPEKAHREGFEMNRLDMK
jgi:hypothetical protein